MLSLRKFVLGVGALALLCTPAFAQGQGRGFGGGMMGGGAQMLGNPSVQKELKFTEEQTSKAQTALTEIRGAHQEEMTALRDAEPAERMTKMATLNKAMTTEADPRGRSFTSRENANSIAVMPPLTSHEPRP